MTWQPIDSAPKDGTQILVYQDPDLPGSKVMAAVWWYEEIYQAYEPIDGDRNTYRLVTKRKQGRWRPDPWSHFTPTHWMPLPEPPSTS